MVVFVLNFKLQTSNFKLYISNFKSTDWLSFSSQRKYSCAESQKDENLNFTHFNLNNGTYYRVLHIRSSSVSPLTRIHYSQIKIDTLRCRMLNGISRGEISKFICLCGWFNRFEHHIVWGFHLTFMHWISIIIENSAHEKDSTFDFRRRTCTKFDSD